MYVVSPNAQTRRLFAFGDDDFSVCRVCLLVFTFEKDKFSSGQCVGKCALYILNTWATRHTQWLTMLVEIMREFTRPSYIICEVGLMYCVDVDVICTPAEVYVVIAFLRPWIVISPDSPETRHTNSTAHPQRAHDGRRQAVLSSKCSFHMQRKTLSGYGFDVDVMYPGAVNKTLSCNENKCFYTENTHTHKHTNSFNFATFTLNDGPLLVRLSHHKAYIYIYIYTQPMLPMLYDISIASAWLLCWWWRSINHFESHVMRPTTVFGYNFCALKICDRRDYISHTEHHSWYGALCPEAGCSLSLRSRYDIGV